jgi:preprotein translocase subunit YajC
MNIPGLPPALLLAQAGGSGSLMPLLVQFALIIGIIYFIMVRPQQKQRQKHESALKALKRGDEVVTAGGIIGEVIHIRESSKDAGAKGGGLDDRVTIKSGESRLIVERGKIARINGAASAAESSSKSVSSAE